jgi:hypothetical protein
MAVHCSSFHRSESAAGACVAQAISPRLDQNSRLTG